jgi:inorganic pyrophosphatase
MFNAIIEISKNSNMKYEFDKDNNCLMLDRVLPNSNYFPYNYGFIPNTLAPDNDPIDIILLSSHKIIPGCSVKIDIIGGIETHDENGRDDKIICKLTDKCDQEYSHINDIGDIPENHIKKIIYFLKHYKDNDEDKFIEIKSNYNKETALAFIKEYSN